MVLTSLELAVNSPVYGPAATSAATSAVTFPDLQPVGECQSLNATK
jgi:hypothetical protein